MYKSSVISLFLLCSLFSLSSHCIDTLGFALLHVAVLTLYVGNSFGGGISTLLYFVSYDLGI